MIFDRIPSAIAKERYVEAIALYARTVRKRALAVYQVGAMGFPGLSDIDLLIVVSESHRDNSPYFSVVNRLPGRFHSLFRHQPSVLPNTTLDVFQYSFHSRPTLIVGSDVLKHRQPIATIEELWCKLFEGYCSHEAYLARCLKQTRISAGQAVAMVTSLRYVLGNLDAILTTDHASHYAREVDALRGALLADPARGSALIGEMWDILCAKLLWLKTTLERMAPREPNEAIAHFGARFLQGRVSFDALDSSAVFARRQMIDFYHAELTRLRFAYGYLFPITAYTGSQRYSQSWYERRLLSAYYRATRLGLLNPRLSAARKGPSWIVTSTS